MFGYCRDLIGKNINKMFFVLSKQHFQFFHLLKFASIGAKTSAVVPALIFGGRRVLLTGGG